MLFRSLTESDTVTFDNMAADNKVRQEPILDIIQTASISQIPDNTRLTVKLDTHKLKYNDAMTQSLQNLAEFCDGQLNKSRIWDHCVGLQKTYPNNLIFTFDYNRRNDMGSIVNENQKCNYIQYIQLQQDTREILIELKDLKSKHHIRTRAIMAVVCTIIVGALIGLLKGMRRQ